MMEGLELDHTLKNLRANLSFYSWFFMMLEITNSEKAEIPTLNKFISAQSTGTHYHAAFVSIVNPTLRPTSTEAECRCEFFHWIVHRKRPYLAPCVHISFNDSTISSWPATFANITCRALEKSSYTVLKRPKTSARHDMSAVPGRKIKRMAGNNSSWNSFSPKQRWGFSLWKCY